MHAVARTAKIVQRIILHLVRAVEEDTEYRLGGARIRDDLPQKKMGEKHEQSLRRILTLIHSLVGSIGNLPTRK